MNRLEFMKQLERLLADIPENDRLDAITYYNNYFDEAGTENEAVVIRELGSPDKVAATIKEDLNISEKEAGYQETERKSDIPLALLIILAVFASPIILGVGGGLLGALIGVMVALVVSSVALLVAGMVCIAEGVWTIGVNPAEGLLTLGVGCLLVTIGILWALLCVWCAFKWIPALVRGIVKLCRRIFRREERGNKA